MDRCVAHGIEHGSGCAACGGLAGGTRDGHDFFVLTIGPRLSSPTLPVSTSQLSQGLERVFHPNDRITARDLDRPGHHNRARPRPHRRFHMLMTVKTLTHQRHEDIARHQGSRIGAHPLDCRAARTIPLALHERDELLQLERCPIGRNHRCHGSSFPPKRLRSSASRACCRSSK
ncbi:MAG: hypothetical protein BWY17_04278 [Deltaproteobacteria bacterium ADurb.Bin207]|nr:MAG: hypothetical protein BWY17_04278 [Deltaproteobacteria bacterium ADurb.Bin207]